MKNLKKSMFLTTVLMVVLLVVALSTATFAWFTASNSVTTEGSTMEAASTSAANLTFTMNPVDEKGAMTINLGSTAKGTPIGPMIPKEAPKLYKAAPDPNPTAATLFSEFAVDTAFNAALISPDLKFHSLTKATPWTITNAVADKSFFVLNRNTGTEATNVKVAATITDTTVGKEAAKALRIAIFTTDTIATDSIASYIGTLSNTPTSNYGTIVNNAATTSIGSQTFENVTTSLSIGNIPAAGAKKIQIAVWYDGFGLDIANAGGTVNFTLTFSI